MRCAAAPASAAPEDIRDDPAARTKLARIISLFYLPPPEEEGASDGFPVVESTAKADPSCMFALVHFFADQVAGDRTVCGRNAPFRGGHGGRCPAPYALESLSAA